MSAFEELGIMKEIASSLDSLNWYLPTDIQAEAIPQILNGRDVLMAAETGSGKTGAFCLPLLQSIWEILNVKQSSSSSANNDQKSFSMVSSLEDGMLKLSIMDRGRDLVLSGDFLTVHSKSSNWQGCRANKGIKRMAKNDTLNMKYYFEVNFSEQGLARVGWSFANSNLELGVDKYGFGYGGTAKKSNSSTFTDYGHKFGEKFDVIGCIVDLNLGEISFTKNGKHMGKAFNLDTNLLEERPIFPTICVKTACCDVRFCHNPKVNDYKPKDCIWIGEAPSEQVVENRAQRAEASDGKLKSHAPMALIFEPTYELAEQTYQCLKTFSFNLNIVIFLATSGSKDIPKDTHVIVATAGSLGYMARERLLSLECVHFFVIDECDSLLKQGHYYLIKNIHEQIPKMYSSGRRLQTVCCSATLHNMDVHRLSKQLMYFPTWIDLKGEDSVPETVHHVVLRIDPLSDLTYQNLRTSYKTDGVHRKDNVEHSLFESESVLKRDEELSEAAKLLKIHYTLKAIETLRMDQGIIFCRTKLDCDNLEDAMVKRNRETNDMYTCTCLHSDKKPAERASNLEKFKQKQVKFLICTDVAARGIDVKGVPFVIQLTLPDEKANYVHRIGRVGRAERMGLAISLVSEVKEKVWYHNCKNPKICENTRTKDKKGCCIWLDEIALLREVENHLKTTILDIEKDFKIQVDEYDGKVTYGEKRLASTNTYMGHVEELRRVVNNLQKLEEQTQLNFLSKYAVTAK